MQDFLKIFIRLLTTGSKIINLRNARMTAQLLVKAIFQVKLRGFWLHGFQFNSHMFIVVKIFAQSQLAKISTANFLAYPVKNERKRLKSCLKTQCEKFINFLLHRFYVKSILRILGGQNLPFQHIQRLWIWF